MTEFSTSCWSRIIMHVDMNAFFASIEQNDFIDLRNKPIAVTNGIKGSCVITCSYEARAFGVRTGMKFKDAKQNPEIVNFLVGKVMQKTQGKADPEITLTLLKKSLGIG